MIQGQEPVLPHGHHKRRNDSQHEVASGLHRNHNHYDEELPVVVPWDDMMEGDTEHSERDMALHAAADNHSPLLAERNKENRVVDPTG
ncbi:hypothetical protein SAY87_000604 [Trapa incisa]|uniref:Uncharacterized protein n=1 Tax=Trapa incisa TaxID=236973 RepID=A0AAN7GET7_9MYRT|nr:hypothetical protein SAY87_000604 [Trapa incisa]